MLSTILAAASIAVMGPESSSQFFNINGSIQSTNTSLYLNVGSDSTSYKTLTFGTAASTSAWALEGDTIITAQSSSWGRLGRKLLAGLPADGECDAEWGDLQQLPVAAFALPLLSVGDGYAT
ncbi:hypothetical protein J7T55_001190 [Diaporthe amygdali]|uniref:uncharacterized protein n=1 Tax=Phomopsis amygdali TaxID=1214568 RepID=UPI0022FF1C15|nr:uncharacterized protein J7T55_001190 [Diaporthe amygdali]KAJ0120332.1 hypothetical protein J7T55_001190 [Diaporthe amygdali]